MNLLITVEACAESVDGEITPKTIRRGLLGIGALPIGACVTHIDRLPMYSLEAMREAVEYLYSHAEILETTVMLFRQRMGTGIRS